MDNTTPAMVSSAASASQGLNTCLNGPRRVLLVAKNNVGKDSLHVEVASCERWQDITKAQQR